jgi:hypothetical protein
VMRVGLAFPLLLSKSGRGKSALCKGKGITEREEQHFAYSHSFPPGEQCCHTGPDIPG